MRDTAALAIVFGLVVFSACAGTADGPADTGGPSGGGDTATGGDTGGPADTSNVTDAGGPADAGGEPDTWAPADAETPDAGTPTDAATVDAGGPDDAGTADAGGGADGGAVACDGGNGDAGPYGQCTIGSCDCQAGFACVSGRTSETRYGQCLTTCAADTDCPASGTSGAAFCEQTGNACLVGCAVTADCPAWLECVASQMCLPPLVTQGTKTPGQSCTSHDDCATGQCVQGEQTQLHCNPGCTTDNDCANAAPNAKGMCAQVGGASFNICIWWCYGGADCPGDLDCSGGVVCQ